MLPLTGPALEAQMRVTLVARSERSAARSADARATGASLPRERLQLTFEEFEARYGATDEELAPLIAFVRAHGLEVDEVSRAGRCVVARGPVSRVSAVFHVAPVHSVIAGVMHRSHAGAIHVPEALESKIEAVLGLDELPVADPHVFHARHDVPHVSPLDAAAHYAFPPGGAHGRRVVIVELGGGFHPKDIETCARRHGLKPPAIRVLGVDGASNHPADADAIHKVLEMMGMSPHHVAHCLDAIPGRGEDRNTPANVVWTIEATMDLELIGALAPEAELVMCFAPNTSQGKYHALCAALREAPDAISISWGGREEIKGPVHVGVMESLFEQAALQGVTVCCSSGDNGTLEYPASSPLVLGCGGTHLHDAEGKLVSEAVWNEPVPALACRRFCSSGGVSRIFNEPPEWQASAEVAAKTGEHGRGVPDVAAKADVASGYDTIVGGDDVALGGTSAAAPLWAALIARINAHLAPHGTRAGYLTPLLYRADSPFVDALRGIHRGSNGTYQAAAGWNPCTGLGSPDGKRLLAALEAASVTAGHATAERRR
jgi:kumamolisin